MMGPLEQVEDDVTDGDLTIAELIELGTGLNGETTIQRLADVGLVVVKA